MNIPTNLDDFKFDEITISFKRKSNKWSLKKSPKLIVTTGAIGVGKTTFNVMLAKYLRSKNFTVFLSNEVPLMDKKFLELFYSNIPKYSFAFQLSIVYKFNYEMLKLYTNRHKYDYIILDRTHFDTKVFTAVNINDKEELSVLDNIFNDNIFKDFDHVFYLKPSQDTMIQRQQKRNRESEENVKKQYLIDIYNMYESMINEIYPDHVVFENENNVNYEIFFKQYFG